MLAADNQVVVDDVCLAGDANVHADGMISLCITVEELEILG